MAQSGNSSFFQSVSPRGGVILAALTADILADGLNANQIAALGGFITIIGDSLGFISAQMVLQEDPEDPEDQDSKDSKDSKDPKDPKDPNASCTVT